MFIMRLKSSSFGCDVIFLVTLARLQDRHDGTRKSSTKASTSSTTQCHSKSGNFEATHYRSCATEGCKICFEHHWNNALWYWESQLVTSRVLIRNDKLPLNQRVNGTCLSNPWLLYSPPLPPQLNFLKSALTACTPLLVLFFFFASLVYKPPSCETWHLLNKDRQDNGKKKKSKIKNKGRH